MLAAKGVDVELIRLLAANGADPKLTNVANVTALMLAAGTNIVDLGKDSGTDEDALEAVKLVWSMAPGSINNSDTGGWTAMHGAAFRGYRPILDFLIEKGARLDARTKEGWTPLTVAYGILYNGDIRTQPELVPILSKLMTERGLPVEGPRSTDVILANKPIVSPANR
jgi:hypothetical protein